MLNRHLIYSDQYYLSILFSNKWMLYFLFLESWYLCKWVIIIQCWLTSYIVKFIAFNWKLGVKPFLQEQLNMCKNIGFGRIFVPHTLYIILSGVSNRRNGITRIGVTDIFLPFLNLMNFVTSILYFFQFSCFLI